MRGNIRESEMWRGAFVMVDYLIIQGRILMSVIFCFLGGLLDGAWTLGIGRICLIECRAHMRTDGKRKRERDYKRDKGWGKSERRGG